MAPTASRKKSPAASSSAKTPAKTARTSSARTPSKEGLPKESQPTAGNETTAADPSLDKAFRCARAAIDKKAENTRILDLTRLSGFTDYFVICSGMSDRQVQAIADSVDETMRKAGHRQLSGEGYSEGRWVLLDYGDVVVHVFLDALREYYDLETLWADAPRVSVPSEFYGPAGSRVS